MENNVRPLSGVLHHAIATGDIEKVQELLNEGIDANTPLYINEKVIKTAKHKSLTISICSEYTGAVLEPINESTPNKTKSNRKETEHLVKEDVDLEVTNMDDKIENKSNTDAITIDENGGVRQEPSVDEDTIDEDNNYEAPVDDVEAIMKSLEPYNYDETPSKTAEYVNNSANKSDNNNRKSNADMIDEKLNDENESLIERVASINKRETKSATDEPLKLLPRLKRKISIKWRKTTRRGDKDEDEDEDDFYENMPTMNSRNVDDEQLNENYAGIAFFEAVRDGMDMIVQTLLETSNNYQIDLPDDKGFTPAMQAAWHGQKDCLQILLEHGADITMQNSTGCTAAHFAAGQGQTECLELLVSHEDNNIDRKTKFGATPLILAARGGQQECLELLLKHGANPNIQYRGNQNSLLFASGNGHYECIQALIKHNVEIDQANSQKVTPLMRAVQQGHNTCVVLLIDNGANINMQDAIGRTALHFAIEHNNPKALKLLLQAGANVEVKTKGGSTPTKYAERFQNAKTSEILENFIRELKEEQASADKEMEIEIITKEKTATCMIFKNIFARKKRNIKES